MTRCFAINYGGIFIITSILLLVAKCEDPLCSNCTEEHITRKVPGKCDVCWPCDLIECHVGYGSSVACGTTVSRDADIVCVSCTRGVNFSDTSGSQQCQPCATCPGKHEHVLENCSPEHNVKCECEDGYYRNRTTKECLPCVLCCTDHLKIATRCRGDKGEIVKKCKFKKLLTKRCFSLSLSPTISNTSKPIQHYSSVVVTTSSSLMKESFLHTTATPLLERITVVPSAVSKTVQIMATSSSTLGHARQSGILIVSESLNADSPLIKKKKMEETLKVHISHQIVTVDILVIIIAFVVGIVFAVVVGCVVMCFFKKHKSDSVSQSDMEEHTENDGRESSVSGSVITPLLHSTETPCEIQLVPLENEKTSETPDFPKQLSSNSKQEGELREGVSAQLEKGIPTSLDNEPSNKGQRPRKRIPSEGEDKMEPSSDGGTGLVQKYDGLRPRKRIPSEGEDRMELSDGGTGLVQKYDGHRPRKRIPSEGEDKMEPSLDGQQLHSCTDHYENESLTLHSTIKQHPGSTLRYYAVPNSMVAISPSDAEQLSGSHSPTQYELVKNPSPSSSCNFVSHPLDATSSSITRQISGVCSSVQFNMVINPHNAVRPYDQYRDIWARNDSRLSEETSANWSRLSQSERYNTKFSDVPFPLLNKICCHLDIKRTDGKDVRMLADKLGCTVPRDFEAIEHAAIRNKDSTTYVVLREGFVTKKPYATVEDFVEMMKDIERNDVIDLIDDYKGE